MTNEIKVLAVDDERIILNILQKCLEGQNYKVLLAKNGAEALEVARKEKPLVIVSDIMMPVMDGLEFCRQVRADDELKDTPFIVLTAKDSKVDIMKGFEAGINDYIVKPLYASEIICRVNAFINLRLNQIELIEKNRLINEHQKELEKMNKSLEEKVKNRTQELEESNSKLKDLIKEKELLLHEVNHRVKNNLQVIKSILSLQSSYMTDERAISAFKSCADRIYSMSLVHESLYKTSNFTQLDFTSFVNEVISMLLNSYLVDPNKIKLIIDIDSKVNFDINTSIYLLLLINEIITNSLKYAFSETTTGNIVIKIKKENGGIVLIVSDNGIGLKEKFNITEKSPTFGFNLIRLIISQLEANIEVDTSNGTEYKIYFKSQNQ